MTLPRHGWRGRLMAAAMGPCVTRMVHTRAERELLPLDYQAFNRFHHGGKVRAQDMESMHDCVEEGQREGRGMTAPQALLARLDEHESRLRTTGEGDRV